MSDTENNKVSFDAVDTSNASFAHPATTSTSTCITTGTIVAETTTTTAAIINSSSNKTDDTLGQQKRKRYQTFLTSSCDAQLSKARKTLENANDLKLNSAELEIAERVLNRISTTLRGPCGEICMQSCAISTVYESKCSISNKNNHNEISNHCHRVVVAARLAAGVPVQIDALKRCLGGCWNDFGVLTSKSTFEGLCKSELPLNGAGKISEKLGNYSLLLVSKVPVSINDSSDSSMSRNSRHYDNSNDNSNDCDDLDGAPNLHSPQKRARTY